MITGVHAVMDINYWEHEVGKLQGAPFGRQREVLEQYDNCLTWAKAATLCTSPKVTVDLHGYLMGFTGLVAVK